MKNLSNFLDYVGIVIMILSLCFLAYLLLNIKNIELNILIFCVLLSSFFYALGFGALMKSAKIYNMELKKE